MTDMTDRKGLVDAVNSAHLKCVEAAYFNGTNLSLRKDHVALRLAYEKALAELTDALAAQAAARDGWRPIESAPRDGSKFICANFTEYDEPTDAWDSIYEIAQYHPYTSYRYVEEPDGRFRRESIVDEFRANNWHQMTHWHELPPAPQGD